MNTRAETRSDKRARFFDHTTQRSAAGTDTSRPHRVSIAPTTPSGVRIPLLHGDAEYTGETCSYIARARTRAMRTGARVFVRSYAPLP